MSFLTYNFLTHYVAFFTPNFFNTKFEKFHVKICYFREEYDSFDDIIVGNFTDSYDNLTLKTFLVHKFVNDYCSNARWIFVHDDDTFIRYNNQLELLKKYQNENHFQCMYGYLTEEIPHRTEFKSRNNGNFLLCFF